MITAISRSNIYLYTLVLVISIAVFLGGYFVWKTYIYEPRSTAASFDECVQEGNMVAESYPRQCITKDGQSFIEDIDEPTEEVLNAQDDEKMYDIKSTNGVTLRVEGLDSGVRVESPLSIQGEAPADWYYNGEFLVLITDWNGKVIEQTSARASNGADPVGYRSFYAEVSFTPDVSFSNRGSIIFQKANSNQKSVDDDSAEVVVRFVK